MEREPVEAIDQMQNADADAPEIDSPREAGPVTQLKPPVGAGLTMIAGDTAGVCEGDACFVPSLVGKDNVG